MKLYQTVELWPCRRGSWWVLSFPLCRTRVWPDLITYNTAISACSKGQWQIALLLLEDLIGEELVDCVSYNSAVSACCGGSQWEKAFHILQMMTLNHVLPDSITLHVLILSFEYPNLTRHESCVFMSRPWSPTFKSLQGSME